MKSLTFWILIDVLLPEVCGERENAEANQGFFLLQVYLIGDPVQLPATVVSKEAVKKKYDVSLFKRLEMNNWPVIVLDTQYRMHPEISSFPSTVFYHGNIKDGPGVLEGTQRAWHAHKVKFCLEFETFRCRNPQHLTQAAQGNGF